MTREEAIERFENVKANALAQKASGVSEYWQNEIDGTIEAIDMAIEALKNEPILCEDCRHRNTWDNGRLVPQYYRCGRGVKFRDYGYVREDDYCPLGERREP